MSASIWRGLVATGLATAVVASATCGGKVVVRSGGEGGEGGDAPTVPTTQPTTWTTSTWPTTPTTTTWTSTPTGTTWTTTTSFCSADLANSVGATEACSQCTNAYCCAEAEQFEAYFDQDTYEALIECAIGYDLAGPCQDKCITEVCEGELYYPFFQACAACLDTNCCDPLAACSVSSACNQCFYTWSESCCSNDLYVAWDACTNNCEQFCGGSYCVN